MFKNKQPVEKPNFYFNEAIIEKIILRGQIFKPAKPAEIHLLFIESFLKCWS